MSRYAALYHGLELLRDTFSGSRKATITHQHLSLSPQASPLPAIPAGTSADLALDESTRQLAHLAATNATLEQRLVSVVRDNTTHKSELIEANQRVLHALSAVRTRVDGLRKMQRTLTLDLVTGSVGVPARLRALGVVVHDGDSNTAGIIKRGDTTSGAGVSVLHDG